MTAPSFTLFKSTSPANRAEYLGHVLLPDGRIFAIEANVSEHDRPDGTKGKHFEGRLFPAGEAQRLLRGAKVDGEIPADLVTMMEGAPFDDPLDSVGEVSQPAAISDPV